MKEVWKDIPNYEGKYQASNFGQVRSLDRIGLRSQGRKRTFKGRILKHTFSPKGYHIISLCGEGGSKYPFRVHRVVALCFIKNNNPIKYTQINHKDGDKNNNRIENLEWCDATHNNREALKNGLRRVGGNHIHAKSVVQLLDGNKIAEYGSLMDAYKATGVNFSRISMCANNKVKQAGGYQWKFIKKNGVLNCG